MIINKLKIIIKQGGHCAAIAIHWWTKAFNTAAVTAPPFRRKVDRRRRHPTRMPCCVLRVCHHSLR